jgi:hypothetical protein
MIAWLREFGELINYYSPSLTAIATIAIAAFTLTLWRATTKQAELTREAVALGRTRFVLRRPLIAVFLVAENAAWVLPDFRMPCVPVVR